MRVMWIAPNGGNYQQDELKGTGGWIAALESNLTEKYPDMELGISFLNDSEEGIKKRANVTYMPIKVNHGRSLIEKLWYRYFRKENKFHEKNAKLLEKAVREYNPDIVHVWGLENFYSKVIKYLQDFPLVVHIQGLTSNYYNYFPAGYGIKDAKIIDGWINRTLLRRGMTKSYKEFLKRRDNELEIAPLVKNWIGRTDWDKTMSEILSPGSHYFHCDELMRDDFNGVKWRYHYDKKKIIISSTVSECWYKGFDIVVKTAHLLTSLGIKVEWHVYGLSKTSKMVKYICKNEGLSLNNCGIILHGYVNAKTIREGLLSSDVYVHPSYLENSSNAIAEAMMLGIPTIANNIGGNASMLKDNTGILVPANEPYALTKAIMSLVEEQTAEMYSMRALEVSKKRQNPDIVLSELMTIYKEILKS